MFIFIAVPEAIIYNPSATLAPQRASSKQTITSRIDAIKIINNFATLCDIGADGRNPYQTSFHDTKTDNSGNTVTASTIEAAYNYVQNDVKDDRRNELKAALKYLFSNDELTKMPMGIQEIRSVVLKTLEALAHLDEGQKLDSPYLNIANGIKMNHSIQDSKQLQLAICSLKKRHLKETQLRFSFAC